MEINYLITTFKKQTNEIASMIKNNNYSGAILIGNQIQNCQGTTDAFFNDKKCCVSIYNHLSIGVSKNRNYLINKASADYVLFMDDDGIFCDNCDSQIKDIINSFQHHFDAIKFNIVSLNQQRPIKQIVKVKKAKFSDVSSFGVCGLLVKREFLVNNHLYFDENVGPGNYISSGEDVMFLKKLCDKSKRFYLHPYVVASMDQKESTWFSGFDEQYMINKGYNYRIMFGLMWFPLCVYSIIKHHKKDKRLSIRKKIHYSLYGCKLAKKDLKNGNI